MRVMHGGYAYVYGGLNAIALEEEGGSLISSNALNTYRCTGDSPQYTKGSQYLAYNYNKWY